MDREIDKLLEKYYDGETSLEEEKYLKDFFQQHDVPEDLQHHAPQFVYFAEAKKELPSLKFSSRLTAMMEPPKRGPVHRFGSWVVRIAAGLALLPVGFSGGLFYYQLRYAAEVPGKDSESAMEMKKVLAFEQITNNSASDRIRAVNHTFELSKIDNEITQLLINTLNFDPNVNVRLAACQALLRFTNEPDVSMALAQSLGIQTDPNLQITLIEALVSIKEKRAYDQIEQISTDQQVLEVVRLKAQEGLERLNQKVNSAT